MNAPFDQAAAAAPVAQKSITELRRELAAALRLAEKMSFHEGICNHFSLAVPGKDERYLINPYGIYWGEMRPDQLLLARSWRSSS